MRCRNIKFMFSKKATKIDKFFTDDLTVTTYCQIDSEDFSVFVAFLENMNFMSENQFRLKVKFKSKVLWLGLQHVQCTLDSMTFWVFNKNLTKYNHTS